MKKLCLCLSIIMLLTVFVGCKGRREFDAEWIIGKNSKQIIERYGEFDHVAEQIVIDVREDGKPIVIKPKKNEEVETIDNKNYSNCFYTMDMLDEVLLYASRTIERRIP